MICKVREIRSTVRKYRFESGQVVIELNVGKQSILFYNKSLHLKFEILKNQNYYRRN